MVENVSNGQATAQTEATQETKDKYGFDMITSVELMFAKLQNDLAVENREYAKSRIEGIKAKQAEQKEISNAIVALRGLLDGKTKDDDEITISSDLANRINKWTPEGSSSLISSSSFAHVSFRVTSSSFAMVRNSSSFSLAMTSFAFWILPSTFLYCWYASTTACRSL